MSTISVTNINDGDAVTAASVNNQINTIVNDYNGNITATNLASGAVTDAKITANNLLATKFSNPYKFSAYRNAAWTCTTTATIVFDTKNFDTSTNFATGTGLFTAPVAGFYFFSAHVNIGTSNGGNNIGGVFLIQNGSAVGESQWFTTNVNVNAGSSVSKLIQCSANDTIGVQATNSISVGGLTGNLYTAFSGFLVSSI